MCVHLIIIFRSIILIFVNIRENPVRNAIHVVYGPTQRYENDFVTRVLTVTKLLANDIFSLVIGAICFHVRRSRVKLSIAKDHQFI